MISESESLTCSDADHRCEDQSQKTSEITCFGDVIISRPNVSRSHLNWRVKELPFCPKGSTINPLGGGVVQKEKKKLFGRSPKKKIPSKGPPEKKRNKNFIRRVAEKKIRSRKSAPRPPPQMINGRPLKLGRTLPVLMATIQPYDGL